MTAHAAGGGRGRDVGGDGDGPDPTVPLGDGLAEGDALGTGADGVRGVLDVGAVEEAAVDGEQRRADAELAVRAVRGRLGADAAAMEFLELGHRQAVFSAGGLDGGRLGARQDLRGY